MLSDALTAAADVASECAILRAKDEKCRLDERAALAIKRCMQHTNRHCWLVLARQRERLQGQTRTQLLRCTRLQRTERREERKGGKQNQCDTLFGNVPTTLISDRQAGKSPLAQAELFTRDEKRFLKAFRDLCPVCACSQQSLLLHPEQ